MVWALVALCLSGGVRLAWAAGAPERRVLLIMDRPGDPFLERVGAEITGLGLTVERLAPAADAEASRPLEETARSHRAVAAVRMLPTRQGVEVWMADETSGRSLLRQVIVDESPGGPDEGLVALQTAELFRTSLLSQKGPKPSPTATSEAAAPRPAPAQPTSSRAPEDSRSTQPPRAGPPSVQAGLQPGLGVLYSPGGVSSELQFWLTVYRPMGPTWELAVDLSAPLSTGTVSGPEGSADVGAYLVGAALVGRLGAASSPFAASAGVGFAALHLRTQGKTAPPLVARTSSTTHSAAYLRADGTVQATPWLLFGARAVFGGCLPSLTIAFADNEAARFGLPFVAGLAIAELRWL